MCAFTCIARSLNFRHLPYFGYELDHIDEKMISSTLLLHFLPFFFFFGLAEDPGACVGNRAACSISNADLCLRKRSIVARASSILECSPP